MIHACGYFRKDIITSVLFNIDVNSFDFPPTLSKFRALSESNPHGQGHSGGANLSETLG